MYIQNFREDPTGESWDRNWNFQAVLSDLKSIFEATVEDGKIANRELLHNQAAKGNE